LAIGPAGFLEEALMAQPQTVIILVLLMAAVGFLVSCVVEEKPQIVITQGLLVAVVEL